MDYGDSARQIGVPSRGVQGQAMLGDDTHQPKSRDSFPAARRYRGGQGAPIPQESRQVSPLRAGNA